MSRAIGLLVLAGLAVAGAVVGAVVSGTWPVVVPAAILSVVLGVGAARLVHAELLGSRHQAATDRADLARSYNRLDAARSAEQETYVAGLRTRLSASQASLDDLAGALLHAQGRAATAVRRQEAETRRTAELRASSADAQLRVSELEQEVLVLRSELMAVGATFGDAGHHRRHA